MLPTQQTIVMMLLQRQANVHVSIGRERKSIMDYVVQDPKTVNMDVQLRAWALMGILVLATLLSYPHTPMLLVCHILCLSVVVKIYL